MFKKILFLSCFVVCYADAMNNIPNNNNNNQNIPLTKPKNKYIDAKANLNLKNDNKTLNTQVQQLIGEKNNLLGEKQALETDKTNKITKLEGENKILGAWRGDWSNTDNSKLTNEIHNLNHKIKILTIENINLKTENQKLGFVNQNQLLKSDISNIWYVPLTRSNGNIKIEKHKKKMLDTMKSKTKKVLPKKEATRYQLWSCNLWDMRNIGFQHSYQQNLLINQEKHKKTTKFLFLVLINVFLWVYHEM